MDRRDDEIRRGAAVYSSRTLSIYDLLVVRFSNTFVWRCDRREIVRLYQRNLRGRHLDVGPGTGWYLAHTALPPDGSLTLMDLNPNSLDAASARLAAASPRTVVGDVFRPLPESVGPFDSVGANFLLHCIPGTWSEKGVAVGRLAAGLTADGVLFGSTILGHGVEHSILGRRLLDVYNGRGIFHNRNDDADGLQRVLAEHFSDVSIDVIGTVAVFRAQSPRTVRQPGPGSEPEPQR